MKIAFYSTHKFELEPFQRANADRHEVKFIDTYLSLDTVVLAEGCEAATLFANDDGSGPILEQLNQVGVKYLALRSAGYNHIDLATAHKLGMKVANVPAYSPYSVAEHTVALMLSLNRKLIRAHSRVRELNFSLDGLTGFDMNGKTVGILGTGKIGQVVAKIMNGFGCRLLGYDLKPDRELVEKYGMEYVEVDELCSRSDIITLHVPLNEHTRYLIDTPQIQLMKKGVMLINTSRGGLLNTRAVIHGLKKGHIGYLGIDVYEEEKGLFFEDHSENILQDDIIARLLTFNNVQVTSHQAFLTQTALQNIADTTLYNLDCWATGKTSENELL